MQCTQQLGLLVAWRKRVDKRHLQDVVTSPYFEEADPPIILWPFHYKSSRWSHGPMLNLFPSQHPDQHSVTDEPPDRYFAKFFKQGLSLNWSSTQQPLYHAHDPPQDHVSNHMDIRWQRCLYPYGLHWVTQKLVLDSSKAKGLLAYAF